MTKAQERAIEIFGENAKENMEFYQGFVANHTEEQIENLLPGLTYQVNTQPNVNLATHAEAVIVSKDNAPEGKITETLWKGRVFDVKEDDTVKSLIRRIENEFE